MKLGGTDRVFKRAVVSSLIAHLALFLLIIVSPSLPKTSKKGIVHYLPLNFIAISGGGGGGGTGSGEGTGKKATPVETQRETLRDLTTPQKLQAEPPSTLRHPAEKPKKEPKTARDKKAVISKPEPDSRQTTTAKGEQKGEGEGAGSGVGSGLRIGVGGGPGSGVGFGSGYSSQIGLSTFPFTYYLQIITDRVSTNWFQSLVDPGISGDFQTIIYFKIFRDGRISDIAIEQSSGVRSLDLSALRAVQTSAPFPLLPRDYEDEYLGIHLIFEHSK